MKKVTRTKEKNKRLEPKQKTRKKTSEGLPVSFRCFQCLTEVRKMFEYVSEIDSVLCENSRCQQEHSRMRHTREYAKKYQRRLNGIKKRFIHDKLLRSDAPQARKPLIVKSEKLFNEERCLGRIIGYNKNFVFVRKEGGAEAYYQISNVKNVGELKAS